MAGFVSRKSATRWNNAARIVEAAGAGTRFVPGMYREPRIVCDNLPLPGSYPAVAGAAIAAAASGVVVYDGEVYTATNQSECAVRVGDLVGLHVSPSCEAFFVPCVCNCNAGPHDCCDKSIALCVNGYTKILKVNGGSAEWTITECCECDSTAILTISLTCTGSTVTASWDYECGATTSSGTFDLSGLCDDPIVEYDDTITMSGCPVRIIATENAENCLGCNEAPCDDPDNCVQTDCCTEPVPKTLTLTITGGAFAGAYGMTWDGVSEWAIDGSPGFTARLSCSGGGPEWVLTLEAETYGPNAEVCDPFSLTFDTTTPVWSVGATAASIS